MQKIRHILAIIVAVLCCYACADDESFTTSPKALLTFSRDTVSFDTVFCGIGSSTERLIVYNHGNKGLRLNQICLENGSGSLFRMNVDGQFGDNVSDVEIPAKDSIFIFLETMLDESDDLQVSATDNIVFNLESGVSQKVALDVTGLKAISMRHEVIERDTVLTDSIPYIIYDSLVVAPDACLTLQAGARLFFHKDASLIVHGRLTVDGEAGREVTLRCDRMDHLLKDTPYDRVDGQWGGVMLANDCTGCDIRFADIHGGLFGIDCDSIAGKLNIHNSTLHNVSGNALRIRRSEALVTNSQLTYAQDHCLNLVRANADFYHCTIARTRRYGACVAMNFQKSSDGDSIQNIRTNFYNCLITTDYGEDAIEALVEEDGDDKGENNDNDKGESKDEGEGSDTGNAEAVTSPLHFYSCLLLTDVDDKKYFTDCIADSPDSAAYKTTNFNIDDGRIYRLDSLSCAIGRANPEYTRLYPIDREGKPHSQDKPSIGCYSTVVASEDAE